MERRGTDRTPINVRLTCRMPASPRAAIVQDISREGCRLEVPGGPIERGATALLELPGALSVSGQIVWVDGRTAGIRFQRALGQRAAVALGLEQPAPPPPPLEYKSERSGGLLSHWFRRLTGRRA